MSFIKGRCCYKVLVLCFLSFVIYIGVIFFEAGQARSSTSFCYEDADKDSYGNPLKPVPCINGGESCICIGDSVENNRDCNDSNAKIHPGAMEVCNAVDDNCEKGIDEGCPDSDGDGYPDTIDKCPNDPGKHVPGICGCGKPDIDSDGDGTLDCNDGCPYDGNKISPGICGCGIVDDPTDRDNDGTPDCRDGCPLDPGKTAPGLCNCGTADIDTDNDGTPDCIDLCDYDPDKTAPGICGCGTADIDSDGDDAPDCMDLCDYDPDKTAPGICGCNTPDTDSDNDGTPDCQDGCRLDPEKTAPGICGCNTPDTDSDNDGTPDCQDGCRLDPQKTAPGICGCGIPDTDSDNDGTPDCKDECPNDPGKTKPGICGCGVPDIYIDADGDGHYTPDSCLTPADDCDDNNKTIYPGAPELCDGKDNDCDAQIDEGLSTDADGDGHYTPDSCLTPADDCDDNNPAIWECNTPVGDDVTIVEDTGEVTVTFPSVKGGGDTIIIAEECEASPEGIILTPIAPLCVEITTDATFEGEAQICISYDDTGLTIVQELSLSMVRCDDQGDCHLLTCDPQIPVDTVNNIICACTDHFSLFAIGIPIDSDSDFTPDLLDNCPNVKNIWQEDTDKDGIGDACDNCPDLYDPTNQCLDLCEGDFDLDGDVDGSDLAVFATDFGRTDCTREPPCEGDFDLDGDVDGSDLAVFATDFGRTDCPLSQ